MRSPAALCAMLAPLGDDTLDWYAKAVEAMQALPATDPMGWEYQAAIHGIDPLPAGMRNLWAQCQHSTSFFLPWHRMYILNFERIVAMHVQSLGGPNDWALPYWNYNALIPATLELPPAFRDPALPGGAPNPLFVALRDPNANAGLSVLSARDVNLRTCLTAAGTKTIRLAKGYWVFNADQVENFDLPAMPTIDLTTRIEAADRFVANLALDIRHGGARAFYRPSEDFIQMPERVLFENTPTSTATEGYYGVLLHEIGHACGARNRLDRDLSGRFGSASHAMEEMCAEWIAALMCADLGITAQPRPDHAHYIKNWLTTLKGDKSAAMAAAAKASQAAEYLWSLQPAPVDTGMERAS